MGDCPSCRYPINYNCIWKEGRLPTINIMLPSQWGKYSAIMCVVQRLIGSPTRSDASHLVFLYAEIEMKDRRSHAKAGYVLKGSIEERIGIFANISVLLVSIEMTLRQSLKAEDQARQAHRSTAPPSEDGASTSSQSERPDEDQARGAILQSPSLDGQTRQPYFSTAPLPEDTADASSQPERANESQSRDAILVAGCTGAGKSSFIAKVTGKAVEVGDSIESCTKAITPSDYKLSS